MVNGAQIQPNALQSEEYVVPLTPLGLDVQFLSSALKDVAVALGAVTVVVAAAPPALNAARLDSASFARLASTPVPAANPITAADSNAIINESMKTNVEHPHIVLLFVVLSGSGCVVPYADWS